MVKISNIEIIVRLIYRSLRTIVCEIENKICSSMFPDSFSIRPLVRVIISYCSFISVGK